MGQDPDPPRSPARLLVPWAGLALLHLAFAGRVGGADIGLAVLSAGLATALLAWVDRASGRCFRHHPEWVLLSWRIARHIVRDCAVVARSLADSLRHRKSIQGVFRELPWAPPSDAREAASLRALIALGISTAPNSYVVEIGSGPEGRIVLHHLVPPEEAGEEHQIWLP